jgi:hypothetical protein
VALLLSPPLLPPTELLLDELQAATPISPTAAMQVAYLRARGFIYLFLPSRAAAMIVSVPGIVNIAVAIREYNSSGGGPPAACPVARDTNTKHRELKSAPATGGSTGTASFTVQNIRASGPLPAIVRPGPHLTLLSAVQFAG